MRHVSDPRTDLQSGCLSIGCRPIEMTADGIVIGDGSVLIRMSKAEARPARLALDADRDRFDALMTVVGGRRLSADAIRHIEAADNHWRRGDRALANLRLIFADLPRLNTPADSYRLTLAEHLLDSGMAPADLMAELGFSEPPTDLEKYGRDQPRVPAGHGRESGEFGSGGGSQAFAPPVGLAPLAFAPAAGAALVVPAAGALAFVAAMVIPTPNWGGVEEGRLPDMPEVSYRRTDQPAP